MDAVQAIFNQLDRELWIVTSQASGRRGGLIATFVNQASIAPSMPRVIVGLGKRHFSTELINASRFFALHLFGEEHLDWVWRFGLGTGRDTDKFDALTTGTGPDGSPILPDPCSWLECRVEAVLDTGDRKLFLAEVRTAHSVAAATPLTMHRLLQLAPPDKLAALKEDFLRDAALDAQAITSWRAERQDG